MQSISRKGQVSSNIASAEAGRVGGPKIEPLTPPPSDGWFNRIQHVFARCCSEGNVSPLPSPTVSPRQVDQNPVVLQPVTQAIHSVQQEALTTSTAIDPHGLLRAEAGALPISPFHQQWFMEEASLLTSLTDCDPSVAHTLQLLVLHAYAKAATVSAEDAQAFGIQVTPVLPEDHRYHRSTRNELLERPRDAFAQALGVHPHEVQLIESHLLSEVFRREHPQEGVDLQIDSVEKFERSVDQLLERAAQGANFDMYVLLDLTELLAKNKIEPKNVQQELILHLEKIVVKKMGEFLQRHPDKQDVAKKLLSRLQPIAFLNYLEHPLLLSFEFLVYSSERFSDIENQKLKNILLDTTVAAKRGRWDNMLEHMLMNHGYRPSPDGVKDGWLRVANIHTILRQLGIAEAHFAWKKQPVGQFFESFEQFCSHHVVLEFQKLSQSNPDIPYLHVLPEATMRLLAGFGEYDIQNRLIQLGLSNLLQLTYARIVTAMATACYKKNDSIAFYNQIELIHQQIQTLLAILQPYGPKALQEQVQQRSLSALSPEAVRALPAPNAYLKASSMHCLSSVIGAVEAENGSHHLSVAVLSDCYYESTKTLDQAKTHKKYLLDGDALRSGDISQALFERGANEARLPLNQETFKPLDLFVCEFYHNISTTRRVYRTEDVVKQIKTLVEKGLTAKKFTVAIDCTMDLEESREIKALLEDPSIQRLIAEGTLNVSLFRSTQKFDMLGMDNYYGGLMVNFNNGRDYERYNDRMNLPEDQLTGLSYQGIAHLQTHSGRSLDDYRRAIMQNTQVLYSRLPQEAFYRHGTSNPLQISLTEDDRSVFIDIKFPNHPQAAVAFMERLTKFAQDEKLPFTTRASFGFATTNFTQIDSHRYRLNPGLDRREHLEKYAEFFNKLQQVIAQVMQGAASLPPAQQDTRLIAAIEQM